jgi:ribose transport system substrate-binding protein
MKKILIVLLVMALSVSMLAGCSSQSATSAAPSQTEGTKAEAASTPAETTAASVDMTSLFIAQSIPTLNNPWYVLFANGSKDMAAALGIKLTQMTNPETNAWDSSAQINVIENLIALQPNLIEIDPTSTDGINSAIDEARSMGIPVVMSGTRVSTEVEASVTGDNYQGGLLCGEYLGKLLKDGGKVAMLLGTPGRDVIQNRERGFREALSKYPNCEIVAEQVADLERAKAVTVCENILQANPDVDAIWAANDEMALGAVEALRSRGLEGKVYVGGFDCTDDAVAAMQNGEMHFTANQIPYEMGVRAIGISALVAMGKPIPSNDIELPLNLVTSENVQDYVDNQVQNQKDVITNVIKEYGLN